MDINKLIEFTVLAESSNKTEAAKKLGISVPLLCKHMELLESDLQINLFDHSSRKSSLTEAGKRFLVDAKKIASEYSSIIQFVHSPLNSDKKTVRIGMSGFLMSGKLGPYLDSMNSRYPDIEISIFDDNCCTLKDVINGNVDMFISYAPKRHLYGGLEKVDFFKAKVLVLVPEGHRLSSRNSINPKELEGEAFILYPETKEPLHRECEKELLDSLNISYTVYSNYVSAAAYFVMVPVGKGLALCPWILKPMIPPKTVALNVDSPDFNYSMSIYYRKNENNKFLIEFINGLKDF